MAGRPSSKRGDTLVEADMVKQLMRAQEVVMAGSHDNYCIAPSELIRHQTQVRKRRDVGRLIEILAYAKVIVRDGHLIGKPRYKVNPPLDRPTMTERYRAWYQENNAADTAANRSRGRRPLAEYEAEKAAASAHNRRVVREALVASLDSPPQPGVPTALPRSPRGIAKAATSLSEGQINHVVQGFERAGILHRTAEGWTLTLPVDQGPEGGTAP